MQLVQDEAVASSFGDLWGGTQSSPASDSKASTTCRTPLSCCRTAAIAFCFFDPRFSLESRALMHVWSGHCREGTQRSQKASGSFGGFFCEPCVLLWLYTAFRLKLGCPATMSFPGWRQLELPVSRCGCCIVFLPTQNLVQPGWSQQKRQQAPLRLRRIQDLPDEFSEGRVKSLVEFFSDLNQRLPSRFPRFPLV